MSLCQPIQTDPGACYLFTYRGTAVAVDLVGGVLPLLLSGVLVLFLFMRSGRRVSLKGVQYYSLLMVLLGLVIAAEYAVGDVFVGSVEVSAWFLYITLFMAGSVQLWRLDRRPGYGTLAKSYAIGTFAMVLSNLFRTFGGVVGASPQIIGAGGPTDVVFLAGPYLALFYMAATFAFFGGLEVKERLSRRATM